MKSRSDQKVEDALDHALEDTFPASDPVAALQPTSAGRGVNIVLPQRKEAGDFMPSRKGSFPHAAGF